MFAGEMLHQSSLGNKHPDVTRFSSLHFFPPGPGSNSRAGLIKCESLSSDPEYIMQLVSDVRKFADVLLHLKEVFNSKVKRFETFRKMMKEWVKIKKVGVWSRVVYLDLDRTQLAELNLNTQF
ncbi:Rho GTPase-activating protein 29 [Bagarius yarrelli]|uniref:Rho GTPase-activating protein 29 n=1 Tax=Bagarius yarrelli TaxID=175774 RepID=A0A556V4S2_BAGYA|nr:Rho GTPase-activating protein 29 [Bagarius yarrelli]